MMRPKWGSRWYTLVGILELIWVYLMFAVLIVTVPFIAAYRFAQAQLYRRGYL